MGVKMLFLLAFLDLVLASEISEETSLFNSWISYVISRGIYSVLGSLIIFCLIISSLSSKFSDEVSDSTQSRVFYYLSAIFNQRSEVDDRQSLLDNLETCKREKGDLELRMLQMETEMALKVEKDRTEAEMTENELKIVQKEADNLKREIESLKREDVITKTYFADQMSLVNERNEEAINLLKVTKAERDVAVRLASQILEEVKGIPTHNEEQRLAIEQMIKDEAKRILFAEEQGREEIAENESNNALQVNQTTAEGDNENIEANHSSGSSSVCPEEEKEEKPKNFVTGSPVFQSFLNSILKTET